MAATLMISAKIATLVLLELKVFWNKGYNVIISVSVHDITNKIESRDSNYIVDVIMRPKICNSSFPLREVIITLIL